MMGEFLSTIFTGANLALLGAFLAIGLAGWGSAKGVGNAACAANGFIAENPTMFGKVFVLEALPATQGIYGFVVAFMIMLKIGVLGGGDLSTVTTAQGGYLFLAALPIALVGLISAQYQSKAAVAGIHLIAKQKERLGNAITNAALVETYAILALLISMLLIINY